MIFEIDIDKEDIEIFLTMIDRFINPILKKGLAIKMREEQEVKND